MPAYPPPTGMRCVGRAEFRPTHLAPTIECLDRAAGDPTIAIVPRHEAYFVVPGLSIVSGGPAVES